jgi:hypothetical protein
MTGDDVRLIRERLGKELSRHLGQQAFGVGLGLANANIADTIRGWESDGATGLATTALSYLRQGLETTLPEFLKASDSAGKPYVARLHWPRFVAQVLDDGWLGEVEWIDEPGQFGDALGPVYSKAFKDAPIEPKMRSERQTIGMSGK